MMRAVDFSLGALETGVQVGARAVANLAELAAALVVAAAVAQAMWRAARAFAVQEREHLPADSAKDSLRLSLGRWLAISLEFQLAADILLTAIAPTWDDIGKLGAVAFIRTALNYFLQKEIEARQRQQEGQSRG